MTGGGGNSPGGGCYATLASCGRKRQESRAGNNLLKEEFGFFWEYIYPASAGKYLLDWCKKAMRSRIDPMKKIAQMLRAHQRQILNWFKARDVISLGAVEGLNNKEKLITRKAYGFRTFKAIEVALYHTLGALPELKTTHRFC